MTAPLAAALLCLSAAAGSGSSTRIAVLPAAQIPDELQRALDLHRAAGEQAFKVLDIVERQMAAATTSDERKEVRDVQTKALDNARDALRNYERERGRMGPDLDASQAAAASLAANVAQELRKRFRCATVYTKRDVAATAEMVRQAALMGGVEGIGDLSQYAEFPEFFVSVVTVPDVGGRGAASFLVRLTAYRNGGPFAMGVTRVNRAGALAQGDRALKQFLDDMDKAEVCPWVGTITLEVETKRKQVATQSTTAFCNGFSGRRTEDHRVTENSKVVWKLEKERRRWVGGAVDGKKEGSTVHEIKDDCHPCTPKRQARQEITTVQREQTTITGKANPVDDRMGVAELKLDASGLMVNINAVTRTATRHGFDSRRSTGQCESTLRDGPPTDSPADHAIVYPFGPFDVKETDDVFAVDERKFVDWNARLKEETTYTFSAHLTRK